MEAAADTITEAAATTMEVVVTITEATMEPIVGMIKMEVGALTQVLPIRTQMKIQIMETVDLDRMEAGDTILDLEVRGEIQSIVKNIILDLAIKLLLEDQTILK